MRAERLFEGGDPFLTEHGGFYYIYCTTENARKLENPNAFDTEKNGVDGIYVHRSKDLQKWENCGLCLRKEDVIGEKWFWAPEVSYYRNRFYMVYAAEEHLAIAVSDSPTGPFKRYSDGWLMENHAIDGHLMFTSDGVYLYYVGFDHANVIYAAKLSDDLMTVEYKNPVALIRAEADWEKKDGLVAEGPFVIQHKGLYYLTYSCNHTRSKDYAIGYAVSNDPFGPFRKYEGNPILHRYGAIEGTGHGSFLQVADNRYLFAYHCHSVNPDNFKPRMVCICEAGFEKGKDEDILTVCE